MGYILPRETPGQGSIADITSDWIGRRSRFLVTNLGVTIPNNTIAPADAQWSFDLKNGDILTTDELFVVVSPIPGGFFTLVDSFMVATDAHGNILAVRRPRSAPYNITPTALIEIDFEGVSLRWDDGDGCVAVNGAAPSLLVVTGWHNTSGGPLNINVQFGGLYRILREKRTNR